MTDRTPDGGAFSGDAAHEDIASLARSILTRARLIDDRAALPENVDLNTAFAQGHIDNQMYEGGLLSDVLRPVVQSLIPRDSEGLNGDGPFKEHNYKVLNEMEDLADYTPEMDAVYDAFVDAGVSALRAAFSGKSPQEKPHPPAEPSEFRARLLEIDPVRILAALDDGRISKYAAILCMTDPEAYSNEIENHGMREWLNAALPPME